VSLLPAPAVRGVPDEHESVVDWRLYCLLEAGYDQITARKVAKHTEIDLHRAVALVTEKGCKPLLAGKILV